MNSESAKEIGEFALIERLRNNLGSVGNDADVIVGNGDDAAVIKAVDGKCWIVTCDVQVCGVHFPSMGDVSGFAVGYKSLAVNVSDVAAMGGRPRFALISLGIPEETPVSFLDEVYGGVRALSEEYDILVLGGNVTRTSGPLFVDVFLVGEVMAEKVLRRSGARAGDRILVTGHLGDAAAGLHSLSGSQTGVREDLYASLTRAQLEPQPRVAEGIVIAESGLATAMLDISDGLAGDIRHLCEASDVGAILWESELPVSDALLEAASLSAKNPFEWALHGGEDYELLVTTPAESAGALQEILRRVGGEPLTIIGEILPASQGISLKRTDGIFALENLAWEHFSA
ncbi:MAG: thiamine-phosphate kinase [Nitrospinae bacterium]|nr:thiamine-phosphate kinase [Nitrospinota bacterium]